MGKKNITKKKPNDFLVRLFSGTLTEEESNLLDHFGCGLKGAGPCGPDCPMATPPVKREKVLHVKVPAEWAVYPGQGGIVLDDPITTHDEDIWSASIDYADFTICIHIDGGKGLSKWQGTLVKVWDKENPTGHHEEQVVLRDFFDEDGKIQSWIDKAVQIANRLIREEKNG